MKKHKWWQVLLFILVVEAVGFLSSLLAGDISGVYAALIKPPLAPPGIVFGIVWPVLYALMGISAYLVYAEQKTLKTNEMFYFAAQLILNFIWSPVFFGIKLFWAAAVVVVILDILVIYTAYLFGKVKKAAKWLLVPYIIWILFATYLNIAIAILN